MQRGCVVSVITPKVELRLPQIANIKSWWAMQKKCVKSAIFTTNINKKNVKLSNNNDLHLGNSI